ncbi:putative permease [Thermaerobacter subterraneus DSM 13965]|uniref:Probable membrane transporter protein n=1 Tax=Thermaerobacter subterraneus DSM 13965 TaxID=867903 RepID=K6PMC1_9FIRM|nr:putative permease [Thermaerobacter subterraneus DSM 13965]
MGLPGPAANGRAAGDTLGTGAGLAGRGNCVDQQDSARRPAWRRLEGWAPVIAGVLTGGVNGLLGVGGGTLLVPALVYWFGVPDHRAHGTSILVVGLTSIISAAVYAARGLVDVQLAWQVAAGGMVGAAVGARWMERLQPRGLRRLYGWFLLLLGLRMMVLG